MLRQLFCSGCHCRDQSEEVKKMDFSRSLLHEVPAVVFYYERTLEQLYLDCNHITELPRQLFNCDELRILSVVDNDISFLPPAISTLINLERLNLYKNSINGLPENIKCCAKLEFLDMSVNPLERFPEILVNLTGLQELYLNDTYLEFLPANFGKLVNLRLLELRENSLNALPKTMSRLSHLTRLDIGNNDFVELPEVVSSLHNLVELWIDGNQIRKLSSSIGQLRKMVHFEASNNMIECLPRDIGYWTRVVEFAISNNDIGVIPTTIGNMKNLVGLKLDDNKLKQLPDTLGKLTNLEDLMLSHNYLTHLPTSIGLLRKLRVLTVDKNLLLDIPSELGSCTSITMLSLRGNRITDVPAEIGHMSNLRVLNLVDNHLQYLPMSLLKLDKLGALWLSNNQSQPLVPLQQEKHIGTNKTVLTCFMLPQLSHKKSAHEGEKTESEFSHRHTPNHRHICFASDANVPIEQPGRLTRAPTPYPKELRALSKHAKTIQRGLTVVSPQHQENSVKQPVQGSVQIKEAKVTATPINTIPDGEISSKVKNTYAQEVASTSQFESPAALECFIDVDQTSSDETIVAQPIHAYESYPVIREAKNIRTDIQTQTNNLTMMQPNATQTTSSFFDLTNMGMGDIVTTPQPPPYHIAAAYSRQAQFFNSPGPESINSQKQYSPIVAPTREDIEQNIPSPRLHRNREVFANYMIQECAEELENINTHAGDDRSLYPAAHRTVKYEMDLQKMIRGFQNLSLEDIDRNKNNDCRPRRFIQDKPLPSLHIVAPTPKRPGSSEKSKIPQLVHSPSMRHAPAFGQVDMYHTKSTNEEQRSPGPARQNVSHDNSVINSPNMRRVPAFEPVDSYDNKFIDDEQPSSSSAQEPQTYISPAAFKTLMYYMNKKGEVSRMPRQESLCKIAIATHRTPLHVHKTKSPPRTPPLSPPRTSSDEIKMSFRSPSYTRKYNGNGHVSPQERTSPRSYQQESLRDITDNSSSQINKGRSSPIKDNLDAYVHDLGSPGTVEQNSSNEISKRDGNPTQKTRIPKPVATENLCKWVFGNHRNATVMQVNLTKTPCLSITLSTNWGKGIYIADISGCDVLQIGDKILECDGLDFSKISEEDAMQVINERGNTPSGMTMMISRMK